MTIDDFFVELDRCSGNFEWTLAPESSFVAASRARPRFHIRAVPKMESANTPLDPLGAVCYAITGTAYDPDSWQNAAEALGMNVSDADIVISASKDRTWTGPDGKRVLGSELRAVRARLIRTVGPPLKPR